MSLINDALKKAQAERPSPPTHHPGMEDAQRSVPQPPRRRRRYLFGFIMAVLVVGLFSTAVSSYLVYQILGSDKATPAEEAAAPESAPAVIVEEPVVTEETEPPAPPIPEAAEEPVPIPATEAVAMTETEPAPVETVAVVEVSPPVTAASAAPPEATAMTASAPEVTTETQATSPEAFPEVWTRLQDFEIRGVMSGGGDRLPKVLIYDLRSQKSRSYRPGDLIDGALSLKVASVTPGTIYFENHVGARFSKAF